MDHEALKRGIVIHITETCDVLEALEFRPDNEFKLHDNLRADAYVVRQQNSLVIGCGLATYTVSVGANSATLLSQGPGAEAAAMGSAVVSTVHDPTALYWNPAGLAASGGMISGEHLFLFSGARYDFTPGVRSARRACWNEVDAAIPISATATPKCTV